MTSTSHKTISERVAELMESIKDLQHLIGNPVDEIEEAIKQLANIK